MIFKRSIILGAALVAASFVDVNALNAHDSAFNRIGAEYTRTSRSLLPTYANHACISDSNECAAVTNAASLCREVAGSCALDINARDKNGITALSLAVQKNNPEIVRLLLGYAPDINAADNFGVTPLSYAARQDSSEIAMLLIRYGSNVNAEDLCGATPLMFAVERGNIDLAKNLLQMGANPFMKDHSGKCALTYAVESGNEDLVELFTSLLDVKC